MEEWELLIESFKISNEMNKIENTTFRADVEAELEKISF